MSDTHVTSGGLAMRVVGNNVLVRPDPVPTQTPGGILFPATVASSLYGTGSVLAVGYLTGKRAEARTPIPGLAVGDRVYFIRALVRTDSNPQIKRIVDEDVVRIRASDILLLLDENDASRLR